jgi:hypothetical protein
MMDHAKVMARATMRERVVVSRVGLSTAASVTVLSVGTVIVFVTGAVIVWVFTTVVVYVFSPAGSESVM